MFAMEPVTCRWVKAQLTVAQDLFDRQILGLLVTAVSTKAVDVAGASPASCNHRRALACPQTTRTRWTANPAANSGQAGRSISQLAIGQLRSARAPVTIAVGRGDESQVNPFV